MGEELKIACELLGSAEGVWCWGGEAKLQNLCAPLTDDSVQTTLGRDFVAVWAQHRKIDYPRVIISTPACTAVVQAFQTFAVNKARARWHKDATEAGSGGGGVMVKSLPGILDLTAQAPVPRLPTRKIVYDRWDDWWLVAPLLSSAAVLASVAATLKAGDHAYGLGVGSGE